MGHRVKSCKRYMMHDKRWKDYPYPGKMSNGEYNTVGNAGCGPCACAAIAVSSNKGLTPKKTAKWILDNEGISTSTYGTPWEKVVACMKHYGFTTKRYTNISDFLSAMNKKQNNCAILHFTKGERNGYHWAISGHYVACSGIKVENGKHFLYVLDSSYKYDHEGWYCYEDTMKGLLDYGIICRTKDVKGTKVQDVEGIVFGWPCPGHKITSKYGPRWGGWHQGVDIGAPKGTKIVAAADGTVVWPSPKTSSARGIQVLLYHGKTPKGKKIYTRYQHNSKNCVKVGDKVKRGDKIAEVGSTGCSTGPHLHFEVMIGGKKSENIKTGPQNDVNPEKYIKYGKVVTIDGTVIDDDDGGGGEGSGDGTGTIDMRERIATLYSSQNYEWVLSGEEEKEKSATQLFREAITNAYNKIKAAHEADNKGRESANKSFLDQLLEAIANSVGNVSAKIKVLHQTVNRKRNSFFDISKYLVEAPFIELNIGGYKIGGYKGSLDLYPNYVTGMTITKVSGSINEYNISLVHQVRVGDDPNALDKVFSTNQFNKITIKYGDACSGATFKDTNAIINNVTMNRDYASARIMYNISATSVGHFVTSHAMTFAALNGKPSDRIRKLLYNSSISNELQEAFPAMKNKTKASKLIPNNDASIHIDKVTNTDPITYINYLVGCMSNAKDKNKVIKDSVYFIYYTDDAKNGAGFEIKEIKRDTTSNNSNAVYEVTVGYPDDNNIFNFQITNDKSWSIMYDAHMNKVQDEYYYTIESNGNTKKIYSPALTQSTQEMQEHDKNWWTFMTQFPITANLTMRGLLRPAFLTNYIKINTVFYGQKHISSGLYTILEQKDTLDGNGFRTTFSLVRVGDK